MKDETEDLLALYRLGAHDQPSLLADEAVREAARRRRGPHPVAMIAAAGLVALMVSAHVTHQTPVVAVAKPATPPGLEEGRSRLVMLTLSPATERPGMALQPANYGGTR